MPDQVETGQGILQNLISKASKGKAKHGGLAGLAGHALKVPGFKHGGKVKKTGVYMLHKGENVETPEQFRKRKLGHRD